LVSEPNSCAKVFFYSNC